MAKHEGGPDKHTNRPVLDHVAAGEVRYISTEKNEAYFHVSPSMGFVLKILSCLLSIVSHRIIQ